MELIKKSIAAIFDFLQGIVAIAAVLVMIYLFIMSPQEISGHSMEPTFLNGEYILTNKISYKFSDVRRGDIVIFKSPKNKDIDYIKRVIGLPGETVRIENNTLFVNDVALDESYNPNQPIFGESFLEDGQTYTVPAGTYFVIGDNRPGSSDSRDFGPIAKEDFIGKAILRYWPFNKVTLITRPSYSIGN